MRTRLYIQKKERSKSASVPTSNPFQSRPFAAPAQPEEASLQPQETLDLKAQPEQAKGFGYNFANVSVTPRDTSPPPFLQRKLTIGQPGDKYEQEADQVAAQVVSQINQPQSQSVQREGMPEEELIMKSESGTIQREEIGQELLAHELTHVVQQTGSNQIQHQLFSISAAPATVVQRDYAPAANTYTQQDIYRLRARYEAAALAIAQERQQKRQNRGADTQQIDALINQLTKDHRSTQAHTKSDSFDSSLIDSQKLDKSRIKAIFPSDYPDKLAERISRATNEKWSDIRRELKDRYIRGLNESGWETIRKEMTFDNGKTYTSTITPINKEFHETFEQYGTSGSSSMSPRLTDDPEKKQEMRATNLWHTEYRETTAKQQEPGEDKLIFEAFRSGSLAYSLNDLKDDKRKEISRKKTTELLTAMLVHYLTNKVDDKKRTKVLNGEEPAHIQVVSTSLQSATKSKMFGAERQQVVDQREALTEFNGKEKDFQISWNGQTKKVKAEFEIIVLDFGVNSATTLGKGTNTQNWINSEGIIKLHEAYKEFKKLLEGQIEVHETTIKGATEEQKGDLQKKIDSCKTDLEKVQSLWKQIEANWEEGGTAYELPARIGNLAFLMGHMVHFNCKSGKDRTGLQDVEAKFLAQQIHEQGRAPEYENKLSSGGEEKDTYRKLLLESGSLEVQKINTGVSGYKVVPVKALENNLASRIGKFLPLVQGLKQFTDVQQSYKPSNLQKLKGLK